MKTPAVASKGGSVGRAVSLVDRYPPADLGRRRACAGSMRGDDLFLSLCALLRADAGPERPDPARLGDDEADWHALAALANSQMVGGYLHDALGRTACPAPAGFIDYAELVAAANGRRNLAIRDQLVEIAGLLNAFDIVPMAIKGAAFLADIGGETSKRMPLDLDILVEPSRYEAATRALLAAGYRPSEPEDGRAHAQNMFHPERPVPVDLHRTFGRQRTLLPTEEVWSAAAPAVLPGVELRIPAPAHRLLHMIFHAQLQNRFHMLGRISLQLMLDMADLTARYPDLDAESVRKRFASKGFEHIYSSASYAAYMTVGTLAGRARPPQGGRAHYKRCLAQLRHPGLQRLVKTGWLLSHPFGHYKVGYRDGCEEDALRLTLLRIAQPLRLARQYRSRLGGRVVLAWNELSEKVH